MRDRCRSLDFSGAKIVSFVVGAVVGFFAGYFVQLLERVL